ncbi:MAG: UDP-3-O-(3-hydroxymyristoyl)glucosamine N-acyltransferase [Lentisphaerae bacterium GWF2_45_14]|nr:MAG: UDP-3-O-(3-hydroxymyristoyl)glucosamine N-acyltransferase [Lentisphaerae bacterium GWF2_45_14]
MSKVVTAQEIATLVKGELKGNADISICGINSLIDASEGHVSFLGNKKYKSQVEQSKASVFIVGRDFDSPLREGKGYIFCDRPELAFSHAIMIFAPEPVKFKPGVHPAAVVHETALVSESAYIGPCAVIDANAVIGKNTVINAGCYIGESSKVGDDCLIYANVSVRERCIIGNKVIIHSGTTVGSDGYGFVPGPQGIIKLPQVGIVQIDDDVEIGANCAIDRARFGKTWLKHGVKLDNLVHVAHNVTVGEFSLLIGQCGIAGSTEIGRGVIIAAQAGINGHIKIGDGSKVAGTSGVVKSLSPGSEVVGTPAETPREFMERLSMPKKVKRLSAKINELEQAIEALKLKIN